MYSTYFSFRACRYFGQILTRIELPRQIFEKCSHIRFNKNPSGGSRDVSCGRTRRRSQWSLLAILLTRLIKKWVTGTGGGGGAGAGNDMNTDSWKSEQDDRKNEMYQEHRYRGGHGGRSEPYRRTTRLLQGRMFSTAEDMVLRLP